jgi:hypothetical protein
MRRSALDSQFLPARVDLGRMLAVMAYDAGQIRLAVRVLWSAHRRGHVGALGEICGIAIRGKLGVLLRLLGVAVLPYSIARLVLGLRCEPFGIRAFIFSPDPKVPFFKRQPAQNNRRGKPSEESDIV